MVMFVADEVGPLENIDSYTRFVAGAELNVSIGLARLGNHVTYVTRLGQDPFGRYIHNLLTATGLDTAGATYDSQYPTGFQLKSKVLTGDPEVVYYRKHSAASHLSVADIERIDLSTVSHVHVTGIPLALSEESREATFFLISRAKAAKLLVTFDPNLRPSLWPDTETMISTVNEAAFLCDIILPGIAEGRILTGCNTEQEMAKFYRDGGSKGTIVKLGSKGAYVDIDNEAFYVAGFPVNQVVDTVGAGDGFAVGVISGLLDGLGIADAVSRGNAIGAMQVMVRGDNEGLPDRENLAVFLAENLQKRVKNLGNEVSGREVASRD